MANDDYEDPDDIEITREMIGAPGFRIAFY
jgi:hypothetical protein